MLQFLDSPEDCLWLRETHLRGSNPPPFLSFTIDGNEDCPSCVNLYLSNDPYWNDEPIATYVYSDAADAMVRKVRP